jgi:hypothetical protein
MLAVRHDDGRAFQPLEKSPRDFPIDFVVFHDEYDGARELFAASRSAAAPVTAGGGARKSLQ